MAIFKALNNARRTLVINTNKQGLKDENCYALDNDPTGWVWTKNVVMSVSANMAQDFPLSTIDVSSPMLTHDDPIQSIVLDHTKMYVVPDSVANCKYPLFDPLVVTDQQALVGNPSELSFATLHCQGVPQTIGATTLPSFVRVDNDKLVFEPTLNS